MGQNDPQDQAAFSMAVMEGPLPNELANGVSDAIYAVLKKGMDLDEACSVVVGVAADYTRGTYGDHRLDGLAEVVRRRREFPLPEFEDQETEPGGA